MATKKKRRAPDLRIPEATPEELAQAIVRGGEEPRPETKRRPPAPET